MNMEKNKQASNLISLGDEQLRQLSKRDKADKVAYETEQTSTDYSFTKDTSTDVEDDDPFTSAESLPMEIPKNFQPRVRRVSDVIDSIGELTQEMGDLPRPGSTPDRVPPSPPSSGYGSYGNGNSSHWTSNLPSPIAKIPDVTDAPKNSVIDATPMDKDPVTPTSENVSGFMPVEKYAVEYNMNHKRRGKAVIFNNEKFEFSNMPYREGSHYDVAKLEMTYRKLGFEVIIYNNSDYQEIRSQISSLAQEDHSDADCLIVTVLTHGLSGNYLLAKDVPYSIDFLWMPFTADKCMTLAGKPKIFIIQACRGDRLDPGITLKERRGSRTETDSHENAAYKIPTHADFLIAFSSVEGFYSWRNADTGTWFIQCLCQELQEKAATTDLLKIMTHTARRVALDHESFNNMIPWQHQQKQVPSFNSMLIRDLYLRPKV